MEQAIDNNINSSNTYRTKIPPHKIKEMLRNKDNKNLDSQIRSRKGTRKLVKTSYELINYELYWTDRRTDRQTDRQTDVCCVCCLLFVQLDAIHYCLLFSFVIVLFHIIFVSYFSLTPVLSYFHIYTF